MDPEIPISDQKKLGNRWCTVDHICHEEIAPGHSRSPLCRSFQQQGKILFKISWQDGQNVVLIECYHMLGSKLHVDYNLALIVYPLYQYFLFFYEIFVQFEYSCFLIALLSP